MLNQSNTIASLGRIHGQVWLLSHIGYLIDNNDSKHIQIYMGHNHPELWDQLRETTNSQPITQFQTN
jgi:hypothetical protein